MSADNGRRSFENLLVGVIMVLCFVLAVAIIVLFVGGVLMPRPASSAINVEMIVAATLTALAPPATAVPTEVVAIITPTPIPLTVMLQPTNTAIPALLPPTPIPLVFSWPTIAPPTAIILPTPIPPTPVPIMRTVAPIAAAAVSPPVGISGGPALPYEQICDPNNTFTALQEADMVAAMTGKQVVGWRGRVWDVVSDGDFYKVQVIMGEGVFSAPTVYILGVSRDVAAGLSAEQYITFDGTISAIEIFLGSICTPLKVVGATIR